MGSAPRGFRLVLKAGAAFPEANMPPSHSSTYSTGEQRSRNVEIRNQLSNPKDIKIVGAESTWLGAGAEYGQIAGRIEKALWLQK